MHSPAILTEKKKRNSIFLSIFSISTDEKFVKNGIGMHELINN